MTRPAAFTNHRDGSAPHPIAELLACPPAVADMLNAAAETLRFEAGDILFHQDEPCKGLYVVLSGQLLRRAIRLDSRLTLGNVRAGEIIELASMLSDVRHTYTIVAQTVGSAMRLPKAAMETACEAYPQLRMRLLEELAREVSRGYVASTALRLGQTRHRASKAP